MKSVSALCTPRASVFEDSAQEHVLNLGNFMEGKIDADKFFAENYKTHGMRDLFATAFDRFEGKSDHSVIGLSQAMGGGKTHCMIALGLLAQNKELRHRILGKTYDDLGDIKVVAFNGRETDAPFGIWGSIAQQLGKKEMFSAYYSPLQAPGETAWINLLKDQKILLLFDELPYYFSAVRATAVGNSDLSQVSQTAITNLFSALGKEQLSNVCMVFADLTAAYESGGEMIQSSLKEVENEANRIAMFVEPVELGSDEIYDILRTRLFEELPSASSADVEEIAREYKKAVSTANQVGLTNYSCDTVFAGITDSYPFHPSIKDLYARFKENPNFQQTRGLIRLMRRVVRRFYENGLADNNSVINVFDIDLNDSGTLTMVRQIKGSLDTAISYDISQNGRAIAEQIDQTSGKNAFPYAQNLAKLILMASLSDALHGLLGLSEQELLGFLCAPGIDLNGYKKNFEELRNQCWYLKEDNGGHIYFQNTKNMIAQMNSLIKGYGNESAKKELRKFLEENFNPELGQCYQKMFILPAIDEIILDKTKISLVVFEPYPSGKLHPDLQAFYDNTPYKNRVMFLSGRKNVMEKLYENSKRFTAINQIRNDIRNEKVSIGDQRYTEAENQYHKVIQALLSAIRETFVTLFYPTSEGLVSDDIKFEFKENSFKGEEQIVKVLTDNRKYTPYSSEDFDNMRKKCEARLFTNKEMMWSTILDRAAEQTEWGWYHPKQMEDLKAYCLSYDLWKEVGGYLEKGPFPKEPTDVSIYQSNYDEATEEFTINVIGRNGDKIYYEVGARPTAASNELISSPLKTKELLINFVCVNSSKDDPNPQGEVREFVGKVMLRHEFRRGTSGKKLELKTHPKYEIRYTTDGSNARENGGLYTGEFDVPEGSKYVNVHVSYKNHVIQDCSLEVPESIGDNKYTINDADPLVYRSKLNIKCSNSTETFAKLAEMKKADISLLDAMIAVSNRNEPNSYVEMSFAMNSCNAEKIETLISAIRQSVFENIDTVVTLNYKEMHFPSGKAFSNWIDDTHQNLDDLTDKGDINQ